MNSWSFQANSNSNSTSNTMKILLLLDETVHVYQIIIARGSAPSVRQWFRTPLKLPLLVRDSIKLRSNSKQLLLLCCGSGGTGSLNELSMHLNVLSRVCWFLCHLFLSPLRLRTSSSTAGFNNLCRHFSIYGC